MGRFSQLLIKIISFPIRLYQLAIRPFLPMSCRFYPSCSQYAIEAINTHGLLKGTCLALFRLCRCNPLAKGGIDYVPPSNLNKREL